LRRLAPRLNFVGRDGARTAVNPSTRGGTTAVPPGLILSDPRHWRVLSRRQTRPAEPGFAAR